MPMMIYLGLNIIWISYCQNEHEKKYVGSFLNRSGCCSQISCPLVIVLSFSFKKLNRKLEAAPHEATSECVASNSFAENWANELILPNTTIDVALNATRL